MQVFYVQDVPGEEVEELKEFEREHLQQLDTQALNIELTQVDDKLSASRWMIFFETCTGLSWENGNFWLFYVTAMIWKFKYFKYFLMFAWYPGIVRMTTIIVCVRIRIWSVPELFIYGGPFNPDLVSKVPVKL